MEKDERLAKLREATLAANDTTGSASEVEQAQTLRDLLIRQAHHHGGATVAEIEEATHLAPEQITATLAEPDAKEFAT